MVTAQADHIIFTDWTHEIAATMEGAVRHVIAHLDDPDEQGGYFCLMAKDGNPAALQSLIMGVGRVPREKWRKCLNFAQEKTRRLAEHPEHQASWQSRNPDAGQWGGAIAAGPYILSFSGLPEIADETAMLLTAFRLDLLTKDKALAIAGNSDNKLFADMLVTAERKR